MSDPSLDLFLDEINLDPQAVRLPAAAIEQALAWSHSLPAAQQWRIYLQGLALLGFEEWLQSCEPTWQPQREFGAIPTDVPMLSAVCNVEVAGFRLCLLPQTAMDEVQVRLPRATVELPAFIPHYFVRVAVYEELEQVVITQVLSHQQLVQAYEAEALTVQTDWTYTLSSAWFSTCADDLLLFLSCLTPEAVPVPVTAPVVSLQQADLTPLLPGLAACDEWWQVLSWAQGAALLQDASLRQWLVTQLSHASVAERDWAEQFFWGMPMNTANWLQQRIGTATQAWTVFSPAWALRSQQDPSIEAMRAELHRRGLVIPETAGGAFQDLDLERMRSQDLAVGTTRLRLYVIIWPLDGDPEVPLEWTLLLVLGPQPDYSLTESVRLQVRDMRTVLTDLILLPESGESYLYTQIVGGVTEQFWVTLGLDTDFANTAIRLPPFRFEWPT